MQVTYHKVLLLCVAVIYFNSTSISQDSVFTKDIRAISTDYIDRVSAKAEYLSKSLDKKSAKAIAKLQQQEMRIKQKLSKIDSTAVNALFANVSDKYNQLKQKIRIPGKPAQYFSNLDTLATSLKFFENNPQFLASVKDAKGKLNQALSKVNELENELHKAEEIQQFLQERKQFLKQQLQRFGLVKEWTKINKTVFYYQQQVTEYKEMLKDEKKIERKALELLSKTSLYRDFMKKNSFLASLFPSPGSSGSPNPVSPNNGFPSLQTRTQVSNFLQQAGLGGSNPMSQLQGSINDVQSQINDVRSKLEQLTKGLGDDFDMPDFKVNTQKTKPFFKRFEFKMDLQNQRASGFFPTTTDIGLYIAYRLNDQSTVGIGGSYKIGWGNGRFDHIRITNQGIGVRSFLDLKIKGSFWMSGGYEQNYRSVFQTIEQLKDLHAWQQSGLIGVSKIISLKSKFMKKAQLKLLWDFLSYSQRPQTNPVLFRLGYTF